MPSGKISYRSGICRCLRIKNVGTGRDGQLAKHAKRALPYPSLECKQFLFSLTRHPFDGAFAFHGRRSIGLLLDIDQFHRPAHACVACPTPLIMHGDPAVWINRPACVVCSVCAFDDITITGSSHTASSTICAACVPRSSIRTRSDLRARQSWERRPVGLRAAASLRQAVHRTNGCVHSARLPIVPRERRGYCH